LDEQKWVVNRSKRGPRQSTQSNPAQLTARQVEVLRLLAEGLQNVAIAEHLHISPKTIDHHLAAIFSKLL
jgi:DNA-binding NarL/FixJ family response regulator